MVKKKWHESRYFEKEKRIAALEKRNDELEDRVNALRELIFNRLLYPDCMHKTSIFCDNGDRVDRRCNENNCPILDNPNDI